MQNQARPHVNIHDALLLDSDPESIRRYYKTWAATYDADVVDNYFGITLIAELMHEHVQKSVMLADIPPAELKVMDVGCGTGLGGRPLHELGYRTIDGVDLSVEMIAKARESGWYQQLFAGVDVHQPLPAALCGVCDVAICLGVFTPGHVLPEALYQLVAMTRPGGLTVISTRMPYYDTTDYQQVSDRIESEGIAVLKQRYMDAPYRDDGNAHYWIYERL